jgi:hypothetical protein
VPQEAIVLVMHFVSLGMEVSFLAFKSLFLLVFISCSYVHEDADVMIAGGTESSVNEISICGFLRSQALATKVLTMILFN